MSEFKGTKGGFKAEPNKLFYDITNIEGENKMRVSVFLFEKDNANISLSEEGKANAKLIAAAPELLEALQELSRIVEIHQKATENNFAWAELPEAKKAIKKATL